MYADRVLQDIADNLSNTCKSPVVQPRRGKEELVRSRATSCCENDLNITKNFLLPFFHLKLLESS